MAVILASLPQLDTIVYILYVALGLGLVIFFHELGHFAVAKWCDVFVERFSIGFGPILVSRKWGETEYAFSAIPFGGYVKMLGQDDMDPSQMANEEIARDPRSYMAKNVWQRMAIISAGVIMNILTAIVFFAIAFEAGYVQLSSVVGSVVPGDPAWRAGIESGDRIVEINKNPVRAYDDIVLGVALTSGPLEMVVEKKDGSRVRLEIEPEADDLRRKIGVLPALSLTVADAPDDAPVTSEGTSAAAADPPFEAGDVVQKIDNVDVKTFQDLKNYLAEHPGKTVDYEVRRKDAAEGELTKITVKPNRVRELGLWTEIGPIKAIRSGSPAESAGLRVGDKITRVGEMEVGRDLHPFRIPEVIAAEHGKEVTLTIHRPEGGSTATGGSGGELTITLVPDDRPAWTESPIGRDDPLSIPAIGAAYEMTRTVVKVEAGGPAEKAGLTAGDRIQAIEYVPKEPPAEGEEAPSKKDLTIEYADAKHKDRPTDWTYAFWHIQILREYNVALTISRGANTEKKSVNLVPREVEQHDWFYPVRGTRMELDTITVVAGSFQEAVSLGFHQATNKILEIYNTLRNLFNGNLSVKNLHGPVGIAQTAYHVAKRGIVELLVFLGILSVNLAVLNFLPIPVLDGGHMVFLIWEAVTGKRPGEKVLAAATYVGVMFILGLICLVMYLDLFVHSVE